MKSSLKTLREIPKVELHRHLDGSVRFETIQDLARYQGIDLGCSTAEELRTLTKIDKPMEDLESVLNSFWTTQKVLSSYEAIKRVTFENVEDAFRDGVVLAELRFAPAFISFGKEIGFNEIIEGVLDGLHEGMKKYPVQGGIICIAARGLDFEDNSRALAETVHYRSGIHKESDRICGFDLADAEDSTNPETFIPLINRARDEGLGITVHSGENTDAAAVLSALNLYKPSRIGHGIKIRGNEEAEEKILRNNIHLELCITSNYLTRSVPSLEEHPFPDFYKKGMQVSLNSDDPHLMNIDLVHEYRLCEHLFDFQIDDFYAVNSSALNFSFLDDDVKSFIHSKYFKR